MPESPAVATDNESVPWWEHTPAGTPVLLAFVKLDRAGPTQHWQELPETELLSRRVQYTAGVEFVADKLDAAQPLQWQGDGVMLFFRGDQRKSAVVRALEAATALRERSLVDLSLEVRIAVHAAVIPWDPKTGSPRHPAIDLCGRLEQAAPVNGITVTEEVYLALTEAEQRRFALLGTITWAEPTVTAYVFPASLVARKDSNSFKSDNDSRLWEAFRRYVGSPEIKRLRYVGFPLQKKQPPSLDIGEVFIAPDARYRTPAVSRWLDSSGVLEEFLGAGGALNQLEPPALSQPITKLVEQRRACVVLGDPGSGKTTVLRWLAVLAAGGPLLWAEQMGSTERLLPLLVSVGRLAELRERLGATASVIDALAVYFHDRNVGATEVLRGFLERVLEAGNCLVLLDGLDEVRGEVRASTLRWLEAFCARYPRNRFIASARVVGYSGFSLPDGVETLLGPFSDEQVHRYAWAFERACRRWENDGVPDEVGADRESRKLLGALFKNPRLRELARNPFLLSALVLIHRAEGQLPRHRVQAYEIFSRTLCETWSSARRVVMGDSVTGGIRYEEEAVPILGELALRMHQQWPTGAAPEAFVIQTLADAIQSRDGGAREEAEESAREFLQRAGKEVQILLERGAGQWGFLHLTFQEFFTAVGLLSSERFEEVVLEQLLDPRWEEVLRLGVGYMALIQKRAQATQRFIRQVLVYQERGERGYVTEILRKQVYLAALLASEAGDVLPLSLQGEIAQAVVEWIRDMPTSATTPLLRELSSTDFTDRLLDALFPMIQSTEETARLKAVHALGMLDVPRARQMLRSFVKDPSDAVRLLLAYTLVNSNSSASGEDLRTLVQDSPRAFRAIIFVFMIGSGKAWVSRFINSMAETSDKEVLKSLRIAFLTMSLGMEMSSDWIPDSINPDLIKNLIYLGTEHEDQELSELAERVNSDFEKHHSHPQRLRLNKNRDNAVDVISVIDNISNSLLKAKDSPHTGGNSNKSEQELDISRELELRCMHWWEGEQVLNMLITATTDAAPRLRAAALSSLKGATDERVTRVMQRSLHDPEPRVRLKALQGLGAVEPPSSALNAVKQLAQAPHNQQERQLALAVLWKLAAKEARA